jgi:hypothetical protein
MAEYKTADKLPILEEVTESTYALVEDNGTLKRVPGSNLGGGSSCCVISIDKSAATDTDAEGTGSDRTVYTCNMDYNELMEAFQNKTLTGLNIMIYADPEMQLGSINRVYFGPNAPGIMIMWEGQNLGGTLCFASNNTISEFGSGPS